MAQHDYSIDNQGFPSFRADLNGVLEAVNTSNSGTSRPTSAVAGTVWLDVTNATNPTLKFFDGTDDISLAQFDYSANTVNWLDSTVATDLVNDTTPQLGGDLDLNSSDVTGTGNVNITGTVTATSFSGDGSGLSGVTSVGGATGVDFNDNVKARFGTGNDLEIYHDSSHSYISEVGTGALILDTNGTDVRINKGTTENMAKFNTDGAVELYYDNAKKFETKSDGINVTGTVYADGLSMNDNQNIFLGNSADLRLYHDGSHSYIDDAGTGRMYIRGNDGVIIQKYTGENMIVSNADGSVELFHNNVKKLQTQSDGIEITGHVIPNANDTYDLGETGNVWRNIYTGDLHLSNEAKEQGNSIDGTKGNWTIQEGSDDLFIVNNKSGKKYKFKLEEI